MLRLIFLTLIAMLISLPCFAHKPSDSYLRLAVKDRTVSGEWAIALRDLELTVGIDSNGDGNITWGELRRRQAALKNHLSGTLTISAAKAPCPIQFGPMLVDEYSDGHYALFHFTAVCPKTINALTVDDRFLFDMDAQHKDLVSLSANDYMQSTILSADLRHASLNTHAPNVLRQFLEYTRQGILHIWFGFDHLLFLVALVLPSAYVYRNGVLRTDLPFGEVFRETFTFISAFTVAHALTLALALFDVVSVPSRLVESLIALTIVVSCLNNLKPFLKQRLWMLTFFFGLIHGMGFATVLGELGLKGEARWVALFGFNSGVEIGQLAVVGMTLPIFYTARHSKGYKVVIVQMGSLAILAISTIWFIQRAFGIVIWRALVY